LRSKNVEELEFSVRTANFLVASDLKTLDKLALRTEQDILRLKDSNEMILEEIKEKLAELGANLGMKS
jgi:DNA-directed RNA polymerase subunit alpha